MVISVPLGNTFYSNSNENYEKTINPIVTIPGTRLNIKLGAILSSAS
jgi:hypothetical protein